MNLDLQVEGSRIASELKNLHKRHAPDEKKTVVNALFLLVIKGFILAIGLLSSLLCALLLDVQVAFILMTTIAFVTFGLFVGARKLAPFLSPLEAKFFNRVSISE